MVMHKLVLEQDSDVKDSYIQTRYVLDLDTQRVYVLDFDLDFSLSHKAYTVQELAVVLMMQFIDNPTHSGFSSWLCMSIPLVALWYAKFPGEPLCPSPLALELGCPLIGEPFYGEICLVRVSFGVGGVGGGFVWNLVWNMCRSGIFHQALNLFLFIHDLNMHRSVIRILV